MKDKEVSQSLWPEFTFVSALCWQRCEKAGLQFNTGGIMQGNLTSINSTNMCPLRPSNFNFRNLAYRYTAEMQKVLYLRVSCSTVLTVKNWKSPNYSKVETQLKK